ncbi:aminotransferase, class IV [Oesophagostomum dentatum]|uniref:Branched-chain-amino-acid aminotransferase n=2 Tax=Oesophagostomum dentatum TaxID=61180 RepID=A0A0B1SUI3_OESDE|nr:aminotransferase, class IV [Oesophagostomum dentatum]
MIGTEPNLMVDYSSTAKLYVIAAPAGAYFDSFKPISLLANPKFIRAAKGGVGAFKMGCNYAPTMQLNEEAKRKGCHQVLWLAESEHYVTEAGAMNFFVYWKNEQGENELITASLETGLILPGVTRQSILEIAREMGGFKVTERDFTMNELRKAVKENRVYEMFGAGTAVVVSPVNMILYDVDGKEERLEISQLDAAKSLRLDNKWVPYQKGASLYIRPTMIGTEPNLMVDYSSTAKLCVIAAPAGAYFDSFKPISLLANPKFIRAAKGGVGAFKMGCNYAPTMQLNEEAKRKGCHQVLWLAESEHYVTEAGAMNFFVYWKNEEGENELITASLETGLILPGVTRQSILEIAREMGGFKVTERDFTMNELRKAVKENRVYEMFGAGTAVVVSPVNMILYDVDGKEEKLEIPQLDAAKSVMQRLFKAITDIQYGRASRPGWTVEI